MKSIWSTGYITLNDSNLLTKLISQPVNKINRPTNFDLTKTKRDIINETQITKRKFESFVVNSYYAKNSNISKYSKAINIKHSKIEEIVPHDPEFSQCEQKIKTIVL
jgi:ribosomal protein L15E